MTNTLQLVTRKDFYDSMREYQLYYVGIFFLLFAVGIGYLVGTSPGNTDLAPILILVYLFLAPVSVLLISHDAVAGKWATGELTVLLGLPISRFDVIVGSIAGRTAVVALATTASMVVSTVLATVFGASPNVEQLALGLFGILVVTLTFASLAVAFSSLSKSTTISSSAAFGVFVFFVFQVWTWIPGIANFALTQLNMDSLPDDVVQTWNNLPPYAAMRNVAVGLAGEAGEPFNFLATAQYFEIDTPVYQTPVVAALILVFWITVPVTLAYLRFSSTDL